MGVTLLHMESDETAATGAVSSSAVPREHSVPSTNEVELVHKVGSLVSKHGHMSLSRLASAYDRYYGSFRKEGYGKLKDFIIGHPSAFQLDIEPACESDFVVNYVNKSKEKAHKKKTKRKKKAAVSSSSQPHAGGAAIGADFSSGDNQSNPSPIPARPLIKPGRERSFSSASSADDAEVTGEPTHLRTLPLHQLFGLLPKLICLFILHKAYK